MNDSFIYVLGKNIYTNFRTLNYERGVSLEHFKKTEESSYKSGTTIVGIKGKDFVIL